MTMIIDGTNGATFPDASVQAKAAGVGPAFHVYIGTVQTVTANTSTKANLDTKMFDATSAFDTVNKRFLPTVAGYYFFHGVLQLLGNAIVGYPMLYKNGSAYIYGTVTGASNNPILTASGLIYLNGSTDYVELWGYTSGTQFQQNSATSSLMGHLVRTA